jgi:aspartate carbamoyltransferase regulatory subunit
MCSDVFDATFWTLWPQKVAGAGSDKMKELKVKGIENGTVIDHIPGGKATQVLDILGSNGETTLMAMNVSSSKLKKKDVLKIENKFLSPDETNKISLIAPSATINIIREFKVAEKREVELPNEVVGLVNCPNPNCMSNDKKEFVKSTLVKEGRGYRCYYCERVFPASELVG